MSATAGTKLDQSTEISDARVPARRSGRNLCKGTPAVTGGSTSGCGCWRRGPARSSSDRRSSAAPAAAVSAVAVCVEAPCASTSCVAATYKQQRWC